MADDPPAGAILVLVSAVAVFCVGCGFRFIWPLWQRLRRRKNAAESAKLSGAEVKTTWGQFLFGAWSRASALITRSPPEALPEPVPEVGAGGRPVSFRRKLAPGAPGPGGPRALVMANRDAFMVPGRQRDLELADGDGEQEETGGAKLERLKDFLPPRASSDGDSGSTDVPVTSPGDQSTACMEVSKGSAASEEEAVLEELEAQCANLAAAWGITEAVFADGDMAFWPEQGRACEVKGVDSEKVATVVILRDCSITFAAATELLALSRPMQAALRRVKRQLDTQRSTSDATPAALPAEPTVVEAKTRGPTLSTPASSSSASGRRNRSVQALEAALGAQVAPDALVLPPKALPPGLPPGFPQLELVKKWTGPGERPASGKWPENAPPPPTQVPDFSVPGVPADLEASIKAGFEASIKAGLEASFKAGLDASFKQGANGSFNPVSSEAPAPFGHQSGSSQQASRPASRPASGGRPLTGDEDTVLGSSATAASPGQAAYVKQYQEAYERYYQEWQQQYEIWYRAQWQQWQQQSEEPEDDDWAEPQCGWSAPQADPAPEATPRFNVPQAVDMPTGLSTEAQALQQEVLQDMQGMFAHGASLDDRKAKFKKLMLQYHPDKADKETLGAEVAKAVFQFISAQKAWFLA